ncbi:MAG: ABC transporter permease [Synergistaceae bacterium]|jgi:putative ABC transport system permease protein|nr:ABC transporter permease [Synergistaceae bacterium]
MFEILRTAVSSLLANKTRSLLTMLGVIIGVSAVIAMIAIGRGASAQMEGVISGMGSNMIVLRPGAPRTGGVRQSAGSGATLTLSDIAAIRDECWSVQDVAPQVTVGSQLISENRNWPSQVTGTTSAFFRIRDFSARVGRLPDDEDERSAAKVCVIGQTVATNLFGTANPVGDSIRINRIPFEVVGVLSPKGQSSMGQDQDDLVVVPITTAQRRLVRSALADSVSMAYIQARDASMMDSVISEVGALLRQRHRLEGDREDDFELRNLTQMLESLAQSTEVMSLLLGAVASISLLVGGIGIMNIMLVSVTERTREIGIRMAIGARAWDIRMQFLLEALLLSLAGGILGILLGFAASQGVTAFLKWPTTVSPGAVALAAGFSAFVGVFFGFYPAWKASLLRPIDALRFE